MCSKSTFKSKSPLIGRLRDEIRRDHKSIHTEDCYVHWATEFIWWSKMRNPASLGDAEVGAFLSYLAQSSYSVSSCKQALNALVYLYGRVLRQPLGQLAFEKSKRPVNAPDWLTPQEVKRVLDNLSGDYLLFCRLLYGTGMRLAEGLNLRLKDVDFSAGKITLRDTKSDRDRVVPLPKSIAETLAMKIAQTRRQHAENLKDGFGSVWLPDGLARKYPNAAKDPKWQYVFPSKTLCKDPRTGIMRRHHLFATGIQQALALAAKKAGITKRVSPHVLRHSYATAMIQSGQNIHAVQQLLGHKSIDTTLIYLHCIDNSQAPSPLDWL